MSQAIQLAPVEQAVFTQLTDFCVPKGVEVILGYTPQGESLPTFPDGSYKPAATLILGEPFEVPRWQSLDDGPGQLAVLDFIVLVSTGSARALTVARDVVVAALDKWQPPGCGLIRPIDSIARTPVDSFLFPSKFVKPLGFMCTIGA